MKYVTRFPYGHYTEKAVYSFGGREFSTTELYDKVVEICPEVLEQKGFIEENVRQSIIKLRDVGAVVNTGRKHGRGGCSFYKETKREQE